MKLKHLWIVALFLTSFLSLCWTFNQPAKSDMVEGLNTVDGMPKYINATATGSLYVHVADFSTLAATTSIPLMHTFTAGCTDVAPASNSGTALYPGAESQNFALFNTSTSTVNFNLNAAASAVAGFPLGQNMIISDNQFVYTIMSAYNTGGATATVCFIHGRL